MSTPRVAAIHDMSGFGRCSLTVAIPILSAMGIQCCPLPTAFLSTHTGGFEGFTFLDMTDELPKVAAHWKSLGLEFQAVYSGFLGSERQIAIVEDFLREFRGADTAAVIDPVMGDHGEVYQTYTPAMCAGMARLAELADVIVPNLTEAAVLLGEEEPVPEKPEEKPASAGADVPASEGTAPAGEKATDGFIPRAPVVSNEMAPMTGKEPPSAKGE